MTEQSNIERWKPVADYLGIYEISSFGRVRSIARIDSAGKKRKQRYMRPSSTADGYLKVTLWQSNKYEERYVHRMVANAFLAPMPNRNVVNHIDGNPGNNNMKNIEWVTASENSIHASRILHIRVRAVRGVKVSDQSTVEFSSLAQAQEAGFIRANIAKVISGKRNQHHGYVWFDAETDTINKGNREQA